MLEVEGSQELLLAPHVSPARGGSLWAGFSAPAGEGPAVYWATPLRLVFEGCYLSSQFTNFLQDLRRIRRHSEDWIKHYPMEVLTGTASSLRYTDGIFGVKNCSVSAKDQFQKTHLNFPVVTDTKQFPHSSLWCSSAALSNPWHIQARSEHGATAIWMSGHGLSGIGYPCNSF